MNNELQQRIDKIHSICGAWGLYEPGNSSAIKQALKATSEIGELADAILLNDMEEIKDAIGDVFVCWVNNAKLSLTIELQFTGSYSDYDGEECAVLLNGNQPYVRLLQRIAYWYGLDFLECIDSAIEVIGKRTGKIISGTFIKD